MHIGTKAEHGDLLGGKKKSTEVIRGASAYFLGNKKV